MAKANTVGNSILFTAPIIWDQYDQKKSVLLVKEILKEYKLFYILLTHFLSEVLTYKLYWRTQRFLFDKFRCDPSLDSSNWAYIRSYQLEKQR